ncbi:hypothetical protein TH53_05100 [Pedobacter lusitanus]|uniref:Uncharacterized protein n=1 Tax=Pedobacter lusitanus TaxID=1503925 RepID=A0A0D0F904_9SPHI|nr:hypothetical protein TH53_05100 [Pedobacter lusitanus]
MFLGVYLAMINGFYGSGNNFLLSVNLQLKILTDDQICNNIPPEEHSGCIESETLIYFVSK